MNIHESYFSFTAAYNPLPLFERWFNPYKNSTTVEIKDFPVEVEWTQRAERQLAQRTTPLTVEMQIYFSCVVKKRVLFHETADLDGSNVGDKLTANFSVVESNSCDPVEFANNFPVKNRFNSIAATKMHPKKLTLDYKGGQWLGEFTI